MARNCKESVLMILPFILINGIGLWRLKRVYWSIRSR